MAELEAMALSSNPAIAEADARLRALRGKYIQVGLRPNPTAGYTASEIGNEGEGGQQGFYVGQQLITGGKLRLNRAVTSQEVQQAQSLLAAAELRVATDLRLAYYDVLIAQERLTITGNLAGTSRQVIAAVEALRRVEEASDIDLYQAKVQADTARMLVENAQAARVGAWRKLASVLGRPELPMADVTGNIRASLPQIEFNQALDRVLRESPQLRAAQANVNRRRWAVDRAYAQVVPNVQTQASLQFDTSTNDTITSLQVGMPLPIVNRNQGGIGQAHGELAAARRSAERLELSLRKQLAVVFQRYTMSRQQVDRYAADILPNVDKTLRLTEEGYRAGEFNFLQLLTVQRSYFQTNLAYLDALEKMWSASQEIEGLLLSGSLEEE